MKNQDGHLNEDRLIRAIVDENDLTTTEQNHLSNCYTCQERCPQGVRIAEFMTVLKNMAAIEGNAPSGIKTQLEMIKKEGRIYLIDDFDNKKRKKINLPPLPTSCEVVKELLGDKRFQTD